MAQDWRAGLYSLQLTDVQTHELSAKPDYDIRISAQTGASNYGAYGALAAHQKDLYVTAVLAGNQIRREARSARKMHELDVVTRAVKHFIRCDRYDFKVGSDQIKILGAQRTQKIVRRSVVGSGLRPFPNRLHAAKLTDRKLFFGAEVNTRAETRSLICRDLGDRSASNAQHFGEEFLRQVNRIALGPLADLQQAFRPARLKGALFDGGRTCPMLLRRICPCRA